MLGLPCFVIVMIVSRNLFITPSRPSFQGFRLMNPTEKSLNYSFGYTRVLKRFLVLEIFFLVVIVRFLTTVLKSRHFLTMNTLITIGGATACDQSKSRNKMIGLHEVEGRFNTLSINRQSSGYVMTSQYSYGTPSTPRK